MNRRAFLQSAGLGAAACLAGCGAVSTRTDGPADGAAAPRQRPNIVLILADDMGFSDISCYGGEIPTPHIDALADRGIRFTQFYNTSRCCPTRASLLTGLYPHEAGVGHMVYANHGPGYLGHLNDRCVTLAEVLKGAGYRTMMTGKWHVGHAPGQWPTDRGFDRFYGIHIHVDSYWKVLPGCPVYHNGELAIAPTADPPNTLHPDREWYTTDVFTDWALEFLDETPDDGTPFFLYVAYNAPHWPLEAPEENLAHFRGKYLGGWDRLRQEKLARMKRLGILPEATELPPSECPEWASLSEDDRRELDFRRALYAAQIERMDQNIGRLVARLRERGALENTLLLFLSDNGCSSERGMFGFNWETNRIANYAQWRKVSARRGTSQGEAWCVASNAPLRKYKRFVHEGGIATPLIAHWPAGIRDGGRLTHEVGHLVDIMATCCDVGQAIYPPAVEGRVIHAPRGTSLAPVLAGGSLGLDRTLYWEHERHAAVRQGKWKLVTLNAADEAAWELYDMTTDRSELHDLAAAQPERAAELKRLWTAWAKETNVLPWPADRKKR